MQDKRILETDVLGKFLYIFFRVATKFDDRFAAFVDGVEQLARDRPKGHRAALRELLNDCLGISSDWTPQQRRQFEDVCRADGLPTLADYRAVLSRRVSRLVDQGEARSEADAVLLQAVLSDEMLPVKDEDREKIEQP
jgi:hypothetical protein